MRTFTAVRIEGGLFAPDLMDQLLAEELPGQKAHDFGIDARRNLTDEIAAIFTDARALWRVFQHRLERLPESDLGTTVTREAWVIPFLGLLGYELRYNQRAYVVGGLTFAISHRAGETEDAPPVHIVGIRQELGRLAPSGRPRLAPHSLVQEFLNRTEALWGMVTNGKVLRLLRDSSYIRRQCYVEFDLQAIFNHRLFDDFAILYRLLHRTRFPRVGADAYQCLLEQYYQHSIEQGGRVRDRLRDGVEECIKHLANGFLRHPKNDELRRRVQAGEITAQELYSLLLRLVYRFLFLFVSEDRGLISQNRLYLEHYSVSRLRRLVDQRAAYTEHDDLWHSLRVLWKLLSDDTPVQQIGGKPLAALLELAVLNGELFEPLALDGCRITNRDLLTGLWSLVNYRETSSAPPRRVNYAALDVEELGSVYESLLEYHPRIDTSATLPRFEFVPGIEQGGRVRDRLRDGSERKSTGSYYTPAELVAELVRSALDPVIEERLKGVRTQGEKERALLSIRVVDPACGSGHFLLAAARRLGKELARIRTGEEEPPPERVREAMRDVATHCIYGVDKNELAVELCRVALWIETHTPGKPLTFLDHRIRCGDSLIGVFDVEVLKQGIPDEAFSPVSGDDRKLATGLKRRNRREREGGQLSFSFKSDAEIQDFAAEARSLDTIPDDSPEAIRRKKQHYQALWEKAEPNRNACDLWTAAFFQHRNSKTPPEAFITTDMLRNYLESGTVPPQAMANAKALACRHRFFHWPLEFPEVFVEGGFDVVLSNPPWERIKLQEKEFFASRAPEIANAQNAATRKRLIRKLPETNLALWREYQDALHAAESASRFLRRSGQYPFTGRGDINTYSVFAERVRRLLKPGGRAGVIVPSGIATDDTNKHFFADLVEKGALASLFDFRNHQGLFPAVAPDTKFCLLTIRAGRPSDPRFSLVFFAEEAGHIRDRNRNISLTVDEIARINPNTRTLPVFRTRHDAELTKAIYQRVPVLINEERKENPWGVRFLRMLDMSNDSHLFRTREQLEKEGFRVVGNRFVKGSEVYLPLYEAKMIWHYDHRFGTYEALPRRKKLLPTPCETKHSNPAFLVQPWYWVPAEEVDGRLGDWQRGWLVGFRDVTDAMNERTAIFSLLPRAGVGHKAPLVMFGDSTHRQLEACFLANLNALVLDFVARQKIGGTSLGYFILRQLPVLPPSTYTAPDLAFVVPRVLELTYTAWDMKPFADDVWKESDEAMRQAIVEQWEENAAQTGGWGWALPNWIEAYPEVESDPQEGIPVAPFRWNEARRARLQAELDAYYARLYGLTRKQLRYILDPADLTEKELADILDPWEEVADPLDPGGYASRVEASKFPGETFRVLKEKEIRQYGQFRTRYLVLEAWERLD